MQLEVGKRYVLRNGEVVGPIESYGGGEFNFTDRLVRDERGRQISWRIDGSERLDHHSSNLDIVSEYIEPSSDPVNDVETQPEPLRWVENCKPDKPGIWLRMDEKSITGYVVDVGDLQGGEAFDWEIATRCYLGPIPEILPPRKKVVQGLWLLKVRDITSSNCAEYSEHWLGYDEQPTESGDWIRTDRTREVEQ